MSWVPQTSRRRQAGLPSPPSSPLPPLRSPWLHRFQTFHRQEQKTRRPSVVLGPAVVGSKYESLKKYSSVQRQWPCRASVTSFSLDFSTYSSMGKPMNSECFFTRSLRRRSSRRTNVLTFRVHVTDFQKLRPAFASAHCRILQARVLFLSSGVFALSGLAHDRRLSSCYAKYALHLC